MSVEEKGWERWRWSPYAAILLALAASSLPAESAELKGVQSGSLTLAGVNDTATLSPAVDTTRSFLVFSVSGDDADPSDFQVSGQITNSTTVTFARVASSASPVTVKWYVAEFLSGVRVKRGTVNLDAVATVDVDFNLLAPAGPVSLAKSFPLVSARTFGTIFDANDYVRAEITSTTNLRLAASTTGVQYDVEWQVVEYLDANVQRGTLAFGAGDTVRTTTAPADFTAVNPAKTWLIYSHDSSASGCPACIGDRMIRGVVTSGSTLTFDRSLSGPTANLTWYLVHFADATVVQHASQAFTAAETQRNVTIAPAPLQQSVALGGFYMRGGRSPETLDDNPGVAWFTFDLTSPTNLRITRGTTGPGPSSADVGWFVVQFDCCTSLSTSQTASTITVTSANNFEMRFNTATGGGMDVFYDLAEDPARAYDLVGGLTDQWTLFADEIVKSGINYFSSQNNINAKLHLLEATSTRVRVRQESYFQEGGTSAILPNVTGAGDYSVYPVGRVALGWNRMANGVVTFDESQLQSTVHYQGAAPLNAWALYAQSGTIPPGTTGAQHFTLAQIDVPRARTDVLQILHRDWATATGVTGWTCPGCELAETLWLNGPGTLPASESWDFAYYLKPTSFASNGDPSVASRSADYRGSDPLSIAVGSGWNENTADADFFNESEAAYTLDMNPAAGLTFDMNGSGTTRYSPFMKARQWRSLSSTPQVTLEGVPLQKGVDYKADLKPIARGYSAEQLLWHCTLQGAASCNAGNLDIGSTGGVSGVGIVAGRHGNGALIDADTDFIAAGTAAVRDFDPWTGRVEFWYQPNYASTDGVQHALWSNHSTGADDDCFFFEKNAANQLRFSIIKNANPGTNCGVGATNTYVINVPPGFYSWRAGDWVHLATEWGGGSTKIFVNGAELAQGGFDFTGLNRDVTYIGGCGGTCPFGGTSHASGIIDEPYIYDFRPAYVGLGGLSDHLNDPGLNYQLDYSGVDLFGRGNYLYLGAESKFRGLNYAGTGGTGPSDGGMEWEYWNGGNWTSLELPGFTDETKAFKEDGTIYWTADPPGWSTYSLAGGPELFFVRAHLANGEGYSVVPDELVIKTDILLFQYCSDITAAAQTFDFALPPTTAVALVSFEGRGLAGAVELRWETASELQNLGFHLYRSLSESGPYERITASPIPGLGSSPHGASYRYLDAALANGTTYFYELEDIETTGKIKRHGAVSAMPQANALSPKESDSSGSLVYGEPSRVSFVELSRSARSLVLELTTSGFEARLDESGSVRLSIPGFSEVSEAGAPQVPVKGSWIEIPSGRVRLDSVRAEEVELFSSLRPAAVGAPELVASRMGTVRASRRRGREGAAFEGAGFYPEEWARIVEVGYQGDLKKALVELSPLRWDRTKGELVLARRLVVRLTFSGAEEGRQRESRGRGRQGVVRRLVAVEPGLYGARFEDVMGRRRRSVPASNLRLSRLGEPIAFHVEPNRDVFGPGSVLYFVSGGARGNPYGNEAVYELELAKGVLMEVISPPGERVLTYLQKNEHEENRLYQAGLLEAPDLWLWDLLMAPSTKTFSFGVSGLTSGPSRLTVRLQGVSDFPTERDHHVRLSVNGTLLEEVFWDGKLARAAELLVPEGVLREGENKLSIENVGDTGAPYSMVMLDRFEVSYPRRFEADVSRSLVLDVTGTPKWIRETGGRFPVEADREYLVVSREDVRTPTLRTPLSTRLRNPRLQADYLVIGPEELLTEAEPLLELRRGQGLRTQSISLSQVYSEFGYGESRPEAVKEFLSYAYHQWKKQSLRYVLLLGDATYDYKDYLRTGVKSQVPALAVRTSYLWTASDSAYAAVNGDDGLPDLAIGRLPAKDASEAQVMVEKILAYERSGSLSGVSVLVADNPDAAGDFEANAEEIAGALLDSRLVRKIYLRRLGGAARGEIVDALDEGASHLSYVGHGGIHLWAQENIFNTGDVAGLGEQPQQPLVLTLNCLNGYFHFPYFDSLSEELLKAEGRGAIAAFSPSGLSLDEPAHLFHKALLSEVLSGRHPRLGDALLAAQAAYAQSGAFPELLRIYHLFGDPALRLAPTPD